MKSKGIETTIDSSRISNPETEMEGRVVLMGNCHLAQMTVRAILRWIVRISRMLQLYTMLWALYEAMINEIG